MVINKCSVTTRSAAVVDIICFLKLTKCVDAAVQPNCDFFVFNTKERKKSNQKIKRNEIFCKRDRSDHNKNIE